jgi:hypothetical protein
MRRDNVFKNNVETQKRERNNSIPKIVVPSSLVPIRIADITIVKDKVDYTNCQSTSTPSNVNKREEEEKKEEKKLAPFSCECIEMLHVIFAEVISHVGNISKPSP